MSYSYDGMPVRIKLADSFAMAFIADNFVAAHHIERHRGLRPDYEPGGSLAFRLNPVDVYRCVERGLVPFY